MKLHGSLNWASETESKAIRPLHLSKYFQSPNSPPITEGTDAILPISHYLVDYFQKVGSIKVEARPVIVPPSWNKSDYHQTLSQVWARAADHLSEARHIFVIGYSLPETDSFFRHLYALGSVGDAPLKSFVVFNPENPEGPVDKRFHNLLGHGALARYKYIQTTFSPAINEIRRLLTEHHQILRQHDEIVAQ